MFGTNCQLRGLARYYQITLKTKCGLEFIAEAVKRKKFVFACVFEDEMPGKGNVLSVLGWPLIYESP